MLIIGVFNLSQAKWGQYDMTAAKVSGWLFSNIAIGLYEEVLLRGICFYLMYRAWGYTRSGVLKAAIAQALIFGAFHIFNLFEHAAVDVFAQVIYAALLGVGFAGIVVYTKSLWTAVFIHAFIDATGTMGKFFIDDYARTPGTVGGYVVVIMAIFIISTLPGIIYLKKSKLVEPEIN